MHQSRRIGMECLEVLNAFGLELFMDNAGTVPEQHVGTGLALNVVAQVLVRGPQDLLTTRLEVLNDIHGYGGGHYPVGTGLYSCRRIGVNHHGAVGVRIAEITEGIRRTTGIE